jgi:hypothetical protein
MTTSTVTATTPTDLDWRAAIALIIGAADAIGLDAVQFMYATRFVLREPSAANLPSDVATFLSDVERMAWGAYDALLAVRVAMPNAGAPEMAAIMNDLTMRMTIAGEIQSACVSARSFCWESSRTHTPAPPLDPTETF